MNVYRIHVSSWTASFRYPNMISGYQPTLPVPPLSTIFGLISAARGKPVKPGKEKIGYVFFSRGKAVDLETIYQMAKSLTGIKSNVIRREFLFDNHLILYTDSREIAEAFKSPFYQLLLGRSGDLAQVNTIDMIDIVEQKILNSLKGTILPFARHSLPALIQALPVCFNDDFPRQSIGTKPYSVLSIEYQHTLAVQAKGFHDALVIDDKKREWDVYWQEFDKNEKVR